MGILANEVWGDDSEIVPLEMFPPASRQHIEEQADAITALADAASTAINLLDCDRPDEAAEVLRANLMSLALRLH